MYFRNTNALYYWQWSTLWSMPISKQVLYSAHVADWSHQWLQFFTFLLPSHFAVPLTKKMMELVNPSLAVGLGCVTCFDLWDVSSHDKNRSFKKCCCVSASSLGPLTSPWKPAWASLLEGCERDASRDCSRPSGSGQMTHSLANKDICLRLSTTKVLWFVL